MRRQRSDTGEKRHRHLYELLALPVIVCQFATEIPYFAHNPEFMENTLIHCNRYVLKLQQREQEGILSPLFSTQFRIS